MSAVADPLGMMLIAAKREIVDACLNRGFKMLLFGAGTSAVAPALAYWELKEKGHTVTVVGGPGCIGFTPEPADVDAGSVTRLSRCKLITDFTYVYGIFFGGRHRDLCLTVVGAGEIDRNGNLNSTRKGNDYLTASGGSNDAVNAREVIVLMVQSKDRLVDRVPYITCPGENITTVVTTMGIMKKPVGGGELVLTGCFKGISPETVKQNCGWDLKVSPNVAEIPLATSQELKSLNWLRGGVETSA